MPRPVPLTPLRTERLDLAAPCEADLPRMIELADDAQVARMLAALPHPYAEADARFFLEKLLPGRSTWAIRLRGDGFIGMIGLHEEAHGAVNMGYWLGRPYWRRGYMGEAAAAVVGHARRSGLDRLSAGYWRDNAASARILARLGFEKTGERRLDHPLRGKAAPHVDTALRLDRPA
ncbi:GNAT family N-acetyltransferase [Parvularcula oceani]|uniref:GNAT family N-acetyltransferase n=1 Tax=Parvularcula oceani TaxID=1247963 RepID=UPI00068EB374|nr:GNAT family N-acetyltransferase [Parvularcula oceani]